MTNNTTHFQILEAEEFPDIRLPVALPISVILAAIRDQKPDCFLNALVVNVRMEVLPKGSH